MLPGVWREKQIRSQKRRRLVPAEAWRKMLFASLLLMARPGGLTSYASAGVNFA